eukprot:CAMPEP_0117689328 /NCGR_PEP_ID=MMETSP0804-20121206/24419_1 /TAXON_ID=1074897 /ORGANISM="Tetraselmis astigmatica, Strain CCMP880" /LENGTH=357 /DNA_ID=CAMNT_0005502069 /DNA_START=283 /DNA_END=1357 /DNA_ORIENTATION=-
MEAAAGVQGLVATGFFMGCELLLRAPPAKRWITAQLTKPGEVLDEKQKAILFQQATSRIVAEVFNIVALPLAILVLTDPAMWEDRLRSNSVISNVLIMFCSGYFIHDTFVCGSQVHHEGFLYLFHAVSCMSIYTYGMISGLQHLYGAVFILFEASTPLVHIHWFLHKTGNTGTKLYVLNGLAMVVVFFLARNVFGAVMSIDYFRLTTVELARTSGGDTLPEAIIWGYRTVLVLMNLLNLFWVHKMILGAAKALRKQAKKASSRPALMTPPQQTFIYSLWQAACQRPVAPAAQRRIWEGITKRAHYSLSRGGHLDTNFKQGFPSVCSRPGSTGGSRREAITEGPEVQRLLLQVVFLIR